MEEVFQMHIRLSLRKGELEALLKRLQQAYARGELRLIKRIHALLYIIDGKTVAEVAEILKLSLQAIYNYITAFVLDRLDSLVYHCPPGRPRKLTKTQRKVLAKLIERGPEKAGYDCGCWDTVLIQDLIYTRFGVEYNPHYVAELLKNMGFSYQKGRFVSDHLDNVAEAQKVWLTQTWPEILKLAKQKGAMILFGDEASFAQWGSLSYTWARKGHQPTVSTSGQRKGYKIFGLIDYLSGAFFYKGHTGKFNSESYQAFLTEVLTKTPHHLIIIQDGARYHTSKAMLEFFARYEQRLTVYQLPAYSPEFNPIEYLWRNIKKQATHLRYFPNFADLMNKVDQKLRYFAHTPKRILNLMGKYCRSLGAEAA
jgi:transposase